MYERYETYVLCCMRVPCLNKQCLLRFGSVYPVPHYLWSAVAYIAPIFNNQKIQQECTTGPVFFGFWTTVMFLIIFPLFSYYYPLFPLFSAILLISLHFYSILCGGRGKANTSFAPWIRPLDNKKYVTKRGKISLTKIIGKIRSVYGMMIITCIISVLILYILYVELV